MPRLKYDVLAARGMQLQMDSALIHLGTSQVQMSRIEGEATDDGAFQFHAISARHADRVVVDVTFKHNHVVL